MKMLRPLLCCVFSLGSLLSYSQCTGVFIQIDDSMQCAPAVVGFQLINAPSNTSFYWDFGDGFVSNSDTVYEFFVDARIVDVAVKLVDTSGNQCIVEKKKAATILAKPTPSYQISRNKLCDGPDSVTLINTTADIASLSWIVDGTNYPNGGDTLIHYFKSSGTKDISMIVTDSFGCQSVEVFSDVAVVHPDIDVEFTANDTLGCITKEVQFSAIINAHGETITEYDWGFEGANLLGYSGETPPKLTYNYAGDFDTRLEVTTQNGCTHEIYKKDYLKFGDSIALGVKISKSVTCINDSVGIQILQDLPGKYSWHFEGNPGFRKIKDSYYLLKYDTAGVFDVTVEMTHNGCYSKLISNDLIKVNKVTANFSSDDNYHCYKPHITHMKNSSSVSDGSWAYSEWTYYNGKDTVRQSAFYNDSIDASDWGRYNVRLVATDLYGCTDTIIKNDFVRVTPISPSFKSDQHIGCVDELITVKSSTPASSYLSKDTFYWQLFDTNGMDVLYTGSGSKFTHTFDKPGKYDVKMWAGNSIGCFDSVLREKYIEIVKPEIDFRITDSTLCKLSDTLEINVFTTPRSAPFEFAYDLYSPSVSKTLHFDFDSSRRLFEMPQLPYGAYNLRYIHRINNGCYDTIIKPDFIYLNGIDGDIEIGSDNVCNGDTVKPSFVIKSNYHYPETEDSLTYQWWSTPSVADSLSLNLISSNPEFQLSSVRTYKIRNEVSNSSGCVSNFHTDKINVGVKAASEVSANITCSSDTVWLINRSELNPTSVHWKISGANSGEFEYRELNLDSAMFIPKSQDEFFLEMVAGKNGRCFDSTFNVVKSVIVKSNFSLIDSNLYCAPVYTQFSTTSENADTFFWDFGDGSKVKTTDKNIANIYQRNTGNGAGFDVQLISKSYLGCSDTIRKRGIVEISGPVGTFNISHIKGCEPLDVKLKNEGNSFSRFFLNYRDGSPLDSVNFKNHIYKVNNGKDLQRFIPSVYVIDNFGCSAVYESPDTVIVYKRPVAAKLPTNLDNCEPARINISVPKSKLIYSWRLDDNVVGTDTNINLDKIKSGSHALELVVRNSHACSDSSKTPFVVFGLPKVEITTETFCLNKSSVLHSNNLSSNKIVSWNWSVDSLTMKTSTDQVNYVFANGGNKEVKLLVEDEHQCLASTTKSFKINTSDDIPKGVIESVSFTDINSLRIYFPHVTGEQLVLSTIKGSLGDIIEEFTPNSTNMVEIPPGQVSWSECYSLFHSDECGNEGLVSGYHCPLILSLSKPQPFTLQLDWNSYGGWDGIDGYVIYRKVNNGNFELYQTVPGYVHTFSDVSLCDDVYHYYIEAHYNSLISQSNRESDKPDYNFHEMPVNIKTVSVNNEQIEVKWFASIYENTNSYELLKYDSTGLNLLERITVDPNSTSITDNNVSVDQMSYRYKVNTTDLCGYKSPDGLPGKSILLGAEYIDHTALLHWNEYDRWFDGVEKYEVQIQTEEGYKTLAEIDGSQLYFNDTELHDAVNGEHCYRIIAHSFTGDISVSNEVCVHGESILWIPNAFSPNEDDLNTLFKPTAHFMKIIDNGSYETYEMTIYNRWGQLLFTTKEFNEGWDGTYESRACPPETYMYRIRAKGLDNVIYNHTGYVRLMR